jgi:steroid delta-isomerase-like uncharacterized protein
MSIENTRKIVEGYLNSAHGADYLADDVVFVQMASGQEDRGKAQVLQSMQYFYQIAFDATFEVKNILYGDGQALLEAELVGVHIGEFAGIPPTGKQVRVPFAVVYTVENDKIQKAQVYLMLSTLLQQIAAAPIQAA